MEDKRLIDVACSDNGTKVIYCSDEFFADSSRMLQPSDCLLYTSELPTKA